MTTHGWRNIELHDAVERWLREALEVLSEQELIYSHVPTVTRVGPSSWQTSYPLLPDYRRLAGRFGQQLSQLPSFDALFATISNSPELSSVLFISAGTPVLPEDQHEHIFHSIVFLFLQHYLSDNKSLDLSPDNMDSLYYKLENYIYEDKFDRLIRIEIYGIDTSGRNISLYKDVTVAPAKESDRIRIINESVQPFNIRDSYTTLHNMPESYFDISYNAERFRPSNYEDFMPSIDAFILATNLILGVTVNIGVWDWVATDQPFILSQGRYLHNKHTFARRPGGSTYILTDADVTQLTDLYPKARSAIADQTLVLPITRFQDSHRSSSPEDKLIDYWISIESFFSQEIPKPQNIQGQAAEAIAKYISQSHYERTNIIKEVKESYNWRNYFMHGRRFSLPSSDLDSISLQTYKYLRRILTKRVMRY
jgi:hypothetical protein